MDYNYDNLKRFFETLKSVGFFNRLFGWGKIKNDLIDANRDLQMLISDNNHLKEASSKFEVENQIINNDLKIANETVIKNTFEIDKLNSNNKETSEKLSQTSNSLSVAESTIKERDKTINQFQNDLNLLTEKYSASEKENKKLNETSAAITQTNSELSKRKGELDNELAGIKKDLQYIQTELAEVKKQNTQLLKDEDFRKTEHSNSVAALSKIQDQIKEERTKEVEIRNIAEIERIKALKETWGTHQEFVKNAIKSICQKYTIEYIDKVPFKGEPDNTLYICDEYVIFDAKSPAGDDLSNFPNYIKDQAERVKKYTKQENVKPDMFFVIPSNTLYSLKEFVFRFGDHKVYIISVDALEPIILSLKKIEEYEFAEQLSPEDRDNICRVLGKFAHLSKRRIQVDSFFAKQFIELAYKCETDLPPDILDSVMEFEKAEKLNPPQEKRLKAIPIGEIEKENKRINQEADGRGILIEDENISNTIYELPLYKKPKE